MPLWKVYHPATDIERVSGVRGRPSACCRRQAAFYRGCLPDDRSLVPLTVLLSTTLALWLLVYLVVALAN